MRRVNRGLVVPYVCRLFWAFYSSFHPRMLDLTAIMESLTIGKSSNEADSVRVFVFGDQSSFSLSNLQLLLLKKNNPYLTLFTDRVNVALRQEIAQLTIAERQWFPAFSSIKNLVARGLKKDKNAALDSTLTTIYQICSFIK